MTVTAVSSRPRILRVIANLTRSIADAQDPRDPFGNGDPERHWFVAWCRGRLGLWWWHRRFDLSRRLDPRGHGEQPLIFHGPSDVLDDVRIIEFATPRLIVAGDRLVDAFRLTREYLGESRLPAMPGWSWFDAVQEWERVTAEVAEQRTS